MTTSWGPSDGSDVGLKPPSRGRASRRYINSGNPFDADRCGADQTRRAVVAGFGIAHADVMAVDHVGDQLIGRVHAKVGTLLALAGQVCAIAIAMGHEHNARFFAFLDDVRDG